jgi:hypothetical protein
VEGQRSSKRADPGCRFRLPRREGGADAPGQVHVAAAGRPDQELEPLHPSLTAIQRDFKIRGYTVGQFPNPPLWTALAALLLARLSDDGSTIHDLARAIAWLALAIWAYEEAAHGVNGFRRTLGVIALALIVAAITRALGGRALA